MLKYKKIDYFEVEYHDFEDFIKAEYEQEYCFVADQECGNDSKHSFVVNTEPLDEYDQADVVTFQQRGKYSFIAHTLLQDLVNREKISSGQYLISVCW